MNRPLIGQTVLFNAFLVDGRTLFCREHIVNGETCKVLGNSQNVVRVLFRGQRTTDIVAPEYLHSIVEDKKAVRLAHDTI